MCDLAAWVWRIAKMGPTEKLVALDAFLAGVAGVGGEAVGRSDAAAVGVAFAAGFAGAGFDAVVAESALEEARRGREVEADESAQTAAQGGGVTVEVGGDDSTPKRLEKADVEAAAAQMARACMLAEELADCQLAGHSSTGYDLIATIADKDLPGVIAAFVGDYKIDGKEHNYLRSHNANLSYAKAHSFQRLRERFAAFFGECCAGEHGVEQMARDWSRNMKKSKKSEG